MPYLTVEEVESALEVATKPPYTAFAQLIKLPNETWEHRKCHAIKIANGSSPGRPAVYFLGGVHAREWGSPDILINFVEQLEQAYLGITGLTFGGKSFSAFEIQSIVNTLDIIVFPQANPDGRYFSMQDPLGDVMWRKNRRILPPNSNSGNCVGVDVNRNYDFLWDFPTYFDPSSPIIDSTNPCDITYNGPSAFSEPESQNVKYILDSFPNIRFFIDLHSYGEDILYNWGDDEDQITNPSMNFQNAAYNGLRGIKGDSTYKEYIPSSDLPLAIDLANTLRDGIQPVRGKTYTVEQSFLLKGLYPTAGTSDDYAYSQQFVDNTKEKVIAYTIEWGTEFQPLYTEMQNIIQEITAGLLTFCLRVSPPYPVPPLDSSKWLAVLIAIFGGVTKDGGGWGVYPNFRGIPLPPDPGPLLRLSKDKQDILIGLAVTEIASIVNNPKSKLDVERLGVNLMRNGIEGLRKSITESKH